MLRMGGVVELSHQQAASRERQEPAVTSSLRPTPKAAIQSGAGGTADLQANELNIPTHC
jgi:hypothetical protein